MSKPRVITTLYHSRHDGKIAKHDELVDVVYCEWCAVGYEDEQDPRRAIELHFEQAHPEINTRMWNEL